MNTDLYTKVVLTIIAGALVAIAGRGAFEVLAQQAGSCGSKLSPCFIATWQGSIDVRIDR